METNMVEPEWPKVNRMEGLTEGRMVHYVMPNGQHRPATILQIWNEVSGVCNLNVLTDGINDLPYDSESEKKFRDAGVDRNAVAHGHFWKTSVAYSEKPVPNTWHWIERA